MFNKYCYKLKLKQMKQCKENKPYSLTSILSGFLARIFTKSNKCIVPVCGMLNFTYAIQKSIRLISKSTLIIVFFIK